MSSSDSEVANKLQEFIKLNISSRTYQDKVIFQQNHICTQLNTETSCNIGQAAAVQLEQEGIK
jgi:hypothetical protein